MLIYIYMASCLVKGIIKIRSNGKTIESEEKDTKRPLLSVVLPHFFPILCYALLWKKRLFCCLFRWLHQKYSVKIFRYKKEGPKLRGTLERFHSETDVDVGFLLFTEQADVVVMRRNGNQGFLHCAVDADVLQVKRKCHNWIHFWHVSRWNLPPVWLCAYRHIQQIAESFRPVRPDGKRRRWVVWWCAMECGCKAVPDRLCRAGQPKGSGWRPDERWWASCPHHEAVAARAGRAVTDRRTTRRPGSDNEICQRRVQRTRQGTEQRSPRRSFHRRYPNRVHWGQRNAPVALGSSGPFGSSVSGWKSKLGRRIRNFYGRSVSGWRTRPNNRRIVRHAATDLHRRPLCPERWTRFRRAVHRGVTKCENQISDPLILLLQALAYPAQVNCADLTFRADHRLVQGLVNCSKMKTISCKEKCRVNDESVAYASDGQSSAAGNSCDEVKGNRTKCWAIDQLLGRRETWRGRRRCPWRRYLRWCRIQFLWEPGEVPPCRWRWNWTARGTESVDKNTFG